LMARDIGYNRSSRRTSVDCCCNSFADENRCTLSNRSVEPVLHRSPALEGVEHSGRMAAWTAPDEFDHLLQFARCEFGHDVVDARLWSRRTAAMTVSGTPSAAAHLTDARSLTGTYPTSGLRAAGAR
jgi:hypothetical protein